MARASAGVTSAPCAPLESRPPSNITTKLAAVTVLTLVICNSFLPSSFLPLRREMWRRSGSGRVAVSRRSLPNILPPGALRCSAIIRSVHDRLRAYNGRPTAAPIAAASWRTRTGSGLQQVPIADVSKQRSGPRSTEGHCDASSNRMFSERWRPPHDAGDPQRTTAIARSQSQARSLCRRTASSARNRPGFARSRRPALSFSQPASRARR